MLSNEMVSQLNEQVKHELYSAQYYLAMAAYCAAEDLDGFAHFFVMQAEEERAHGMKLFKFLTDLGERVEITGLDAPQTEYASITEVFELALKHEQFVSKLIYALMDRAHEEKAHAAMSFLQWFVDEQVEEEASMSKILNKVKRAGDDGYAILFLDQEMATRK
ncbi:MAG: ferritin [Bacillota bacterium]|nr:ferritin [Bacillota bacterium]MDW7683749.1 ferritin [Bacillota bacterium]